MASTYSTNLALELIGTGEQSGTWGTTTNTNLGTLLEQAISGYVTQAITDGASANTTITIPNGTTGVARNMFIEMTGALSVSSTSLIVPANKKMYFIFNNTSGGFAVTVKVSGQTGILVPNGKKVVLVSNGTDIVEAVTAIVGNATMGGTLGVTGATTLSSTLSAGATSVTTLTATAATAQGKFTRGGTTGIFIDDQTNNAWKSWRIATSYGTGNDLTFTPSTTAGGTTFTTPTLSLEPTGASITGTLSSTLGATIQGLTVGLGAGAVATNTAVGVSALAANTTGTGLVATGYQAAYSNTTGNGNSAYGQAALFANTTGSENTAIGSAYTTYAPLRFNTTGSLNTAVGSGALSSNTTAINNTAVGYQSGYYVTTGARNVSLGGLSLTAGTAAASSGSDNTAVGYAALYRNTTGSYNVGVGGSDGSASALSGNTTGSNNTALGVGSLGANTTASSNTAVGYQAGYANTTGYYNLYLGYQAGITVTTGAANILVGALTVASSVNVNNEIVIGQGATGKGASTGFISPNSGGVYQGNNGATWSVTSDQRLKKNIVDNNVGLEKLTAIQVRNFEYRLPDEVEAELKPSDAIKKEGVQLGVIAQELQAVLPECVKVESTGVMSVNADNLTWYLVNAVKELNSKFEEYKSTHP